MVALALFKGWSREGLTDKVGFEARPEVGKSKPCEYGGRGKHKSTSATTVRVLGLVK